MFDFNTIYSNACNYKKLLFTFCYILFLEVIFHLSSGSFNFNLFILIPFTFFNALCVYVFVSCFNEKINRFLTYFIYIFIYLLFIGNVTYLDMYGTVVSMYSIINGFENAAASTDQIWIVLFRNWYVCLAMLLPVLIFIKYDKNNLISYKKNDLFYNLGALTGCFVFYTVMICSINIFASMDLYSARNLYFKTNVPLLTGQKFGLVTSSRLSVQRYYFNFNEADIIDIEEKDVIYGDEYNMFDIDFDTLIKNETDFDAISIFNYLKNVQPTLKNEYTGYFEGKNLIMIHAESFSDMAISKELTPTLYKLSNEGFVFDNFYVPLYYASTSDAEYMKFTSWLPKEGVWGLNEINGNYLPYSYPNFFSNVGYTNQAYHNFDANFYNRDTSFFGYGFDTFKACHLDLDIDCSHYHKSDLELIEKSIDEYIDDEQFFTYYLTFSGHLGYDDGNVMANKHLHLVEDMDISDKPMRYLAANIELDKAVELLIEKLDEAGVLNDTVISIVPDHYPYGMDLEEVNEISDYLKEKDFSVHKAPWILWNSEMGEVINVDTLGTNLDIMPTIYNLFGFDFDSRFFIGSDIFGSDERIVIFSNRSYLTNSGSYNFATGEAINLRDDEINRLNNEVYLKFKYSTLFLDSDLFGILKDRGVIN